MTKKVTRILWITWNNDHACNEVGRGHSWDGRPESKGYSTPYTSFAIRKLKISLSEVPFYNYPYLWKSTVGETRRHIRESANCWIKTENPSFQKYVTLSSLSNSAALVKLQKQLWGSPAHLNLFTSVTRRATNDFCWSLLESVLNKTGYAF